MRRGRLTSSMAAVLAVALLAPLTLAGKGGKPGGGGGGGGDSAGPEIAVSVAQKSGGFDLAVMDADGGSLTTVVSGAGDFMMRSTWSPDGTQLAFVGNISGSGIYVVAADGSNLRKVAVTTAGYTTNVSWSPTAAADGTYRILFDDDGGGSEYGNGDVFAVTPDGGSRVRLTWTTDVTEGNAVWDPAAERIAFVARDHATGTTDALVAAVSLVSGALTLGMAASATDVAGSPLRGRPVYSLDWARGGDRLAVAAVPSGGTDADLFVIDLAAPAGASNVTNTAGTEERHPTWSPDDAAIAFWTPGGKTSVRTIPASGGRSTTLRSGVRAPAWKR